MKGLLRHQDRDAFYLGGNEVQILLCHIENGDKYYAAPSHKGWLTRKQAQEWVKRRYGELIERRGLRSLKPSRKTILAAVTALNLSIKEQALALQLQQEKLAERKTKNILKAVENIQAELDAEKERLELVKLLLKKSKVERAKR